MVGLARFDRVGVSFGRESEFFQAILRFAKCCKLLKLKLFEHLLNTILRFVDYHLGYTSSRVSFPRYRTWRPWLNPCSPRVKIRAILQQTGYIRQNFPRLRRANRGFASRGDWAGPLRETPPWTHIPVAPDRPCRTHGGRRWRRWQRRQRRWQWRRR